MEAKTQIPDNGESTGELWTWRLQPAPGPPRKNTLRVARAARADAIRTSIITRRTKILPRSLHGPDGEVRGLRHDHAFWHPVAAFKSDTIDWLVVHIPGGVCAEGRIVLSAFDRLRVDGCGEWRLIPSALPTDVVGPSKVWVSATPFIATRHLRKGQTASDLVKLAIAQLGWDLPIPEVEMFSVRPIDFDTGGRKRAPNSGRNKVSSPQKKGFKLVFPTPVYGPIAAGGLCHFGMGRFKAVPED